MLVQIGRSGRKPRELVDLLLACHERIRFFVGLARAVASDEQRADAERIEACDAVARYFHEALPLHVRDEEESISPRVRGQSERVDGALASMGRQHGEHEPLLSALLAACAAVRDRPRDPEARARLETAATELERELEPHLASEEELVFPAVAALPGAVQEAILAELRARRAG